MDERDLDAMLETIFEQERADIERKHGEQLLGILNGTGDTGPSPTDSLLEMIGKAHQAALDSEAEAKPEADKE